MAALSVSAQDKVIGDYFNYFGSELKFKPDFTFEYKWRLEHASSWTNGTWKTKNDTVYLHMVPVYDTLWLSQTKARLVLSVNDRSETITTDLENVRPGISEGQNKYPIPNKLYLQGSRLYGLEPDGSLQKTKVQGHRTERKFDPWYMRVEGK